MKPIWKLPSGLALLSASIALAALQLTGCGGGGSGHAAANSTAARSALQIAITWPSPTPTRLIPSKSQSILITVNAGGTRVKDVIIPRPTGVNTTMS